MHVRIARTLRYLSRLTDQHTARSNAAEGSATLQRRRADLDDVAEYMKGVRGEHDAEPTV